MSLKLIIVALFSFTFSIQVYPSGRENATDDRAYWTQLLYKISAPVLSNMSRGELKKNMELELSPRWDGRNQDLTYMECFGRTMAGLAPWLSLPDDDTEEGKMRRQLKEWAWKSYSNAVDPESPDYLLWNRHGQALVDAAYIAESFLRAPQALWEPLDSLTKSRYIREFQGLRRFDPVYSNWILFVSITETFLASIGAPYDEYRIHFGIRKFNEWYVGDGWYSDGTKFAFDYYNSFVIQPMLVEICQTMNHLKKKPRVSDKQVALVESRMQRYGSILERFISPEGTFPAFGRSMTYRLGCLQALAQLAWQKKLPSELTEGQVRAALTAVMKRMYSTPNNFNKSGFLTLGFVGHQPDLSDVYTNNGSVYMTTLAFLPLGLAPDDSFWTTPAADWTQKKAWSEQDFPIDHAVH